jgi:hypothetical protein
MQDASVMSPEIYRKDSVRASTLPYYVGWENHVWRTSSKVTNVEIFLFLETIVTPLAMHNWGWAQATAIQNIGELNCT